MTDAADPDDGAPPPPQEKRRKNLFQRGNPGRPKGAKSRAAKFLDAMANGEGEAILNRVIGRALADPPDLVAAKIILDRIWPVPKGSPVRLSLPSIRDAEGCAAAFGKLLEEVARGAITPEEAIPISQLIEAQRRAIETKDLIAEVEKLKVMAEARDDAPNLGRHLSPRDDD